ncbi:MAG: hypothetical protein M3O01_06755 [Pseudomonadota bacterium]|nr:hypothetical protein [Pseudomonadota bacterium]
MHLILATYRPGDLTASLAFCNRHFPARRHARRILLVNNPELLPAAKAIAGRWEVVAGSNDFGEFSAWQEGLDHLGGDRGPVMFANDTVNTHRHFTWFRVAALRRAIAAAQGASIVGFCDKLDGDLRIAGMPVPAWVSTYCFFLTGAALERLNSTLFQPSLVRACVPGGLDEARFFSGLSTDLENHLRHWLFGGRWYASGPLTHENRARMTRKAEAIIAEKILSATCRTQAIEVVDPFVRHPFWRRLDRVWRGACRRMRIRQRT